MFKEIRKILASETEKVKEKFKTLSLENTKQEDEEAEEEEEDKTIINQLSKTIAESSKVLAEFGMAPASVIIYKRYNIC
jgi:valyl-tRNA synthetase